MTAPTTESSHSPTSPAIPSSRSWDDDPDKADDDDAKAWDAEFVKVDKSTLLDLIQAANYLNIKNLLDLTSQTVANMIKGRSPELIRKHFSIENDFTPEEEEEAEIRREKQSFLIKCLYICFSCCVSTQ